MYYTLALWVLIIALKIVLAFYTSKSQKIYEINPEVSESEKSAINHTLMKKAQNNKSFKPVGFISIAALVLMVIFTCFAILLFFQAKYIVAIQLAAIGTLFELGISVAFPIAQYQYWKIHSLENVIILSPKRFNKLMVTRTLNIITRSLIFGIPVIFQDEFTALLIRLSSI